MTNFPTTSSGVCLPPSLCWVGNTPKNITRDDVYYHPQRGLEESRHIYINGNKLPERFATHDGTFVIGEVGFGAGLNFLASIDAWQKHAKTAKNNKLIYVAFEPWPLSAGQMDYANRPYKELLPLLHRLLDIWPPLISGSYTLNFSPSIQLLLHFFPLQQCSNLSLKADAWFYDAFAPAKDPTAWDNTAIDCLAQWSKPKATLTTFSVAGKVRRLLEEKGFTCYKAQGFAEKKQMLHACYNKHSENSKQKDAPRVAVIGGGLAGCAAAWSLASHGAQVTILERRQQLAQRASRHKHAVFYARVPWLASEYQQWMWYCYCYGWSMYSLLDDLFTRYNKHLCVGDKRGYKWLDRWREHYRHRAHSQWINFPRQSMVALQRCGLLNMQLLCQQLATASLANIKTACRVISYESNDSGASLSYSQKNKNYNEQFDHLVIAANIGTTSLLPAIKGVLRCNKGQINSLHTDQPPKSIWGSNKGFIAPTANGAICGGNFSNKSNNLRPDNNQYKAMVKNIGEVISPYQTMPEIESGYCAMADVRSAAKDHLPLVGQTSQNRIWLNTGYGGKGSLTICATSELLAQQICQAQFGSPLHLLNQLSPTRFHNINFNS